MILIKTPRSYDLVLEFESDHSRKKFVLKLETVFASLRKTVDIISMSKAEMLVKAETKESRQNRLEHFFREAYALTFGLR